MSRAVEVHVLHAFDRAGVGGNPAAVVLGADALQREQKLAIAREVGFSETAFVSRSAVADIRLEFFTPTRQIAHCGHATIATFCFLRSSGRLEAGERSKETVDGVRAVHLDAGGMAWMEQRAPAYQGLRETPVAMARVAASLGVDEAHFRHGHPPVVASTGNRFLLVAMRDSATLARAKPDQREIAAISEMLDLVGFYLWLPAADDVAATTRMFAPRYGIDEESATGMAAGPLACYLRDRCGIPAPQLEIEQGAFMQPAAPSRLAARIVTAPSGGTDGVFVGGTARYEGTRRVSLDAERTGATT